MSIRTFTRKAGNRYGGKKGMVPFMAVYYMTSAVTPMTPGGEIDLDSCDSLYHHLLQGGTDGILLLGDEGEFFAFTPQQRRNLIRHAIPEIREQARLVRERVDAGTGDVIQTSGSPVRILVGTGSPSYAETVELSRYALEQGADGVLAWPWVCSDREMGGIYHWYAALAADVPGSICLKNGPDRTGWTLSPPVTARLAENFDNIAGIRDFVGEMDHTREIIKAVRPLRENFTVCSGFDDCFARNVLSGGNGCIGGISNLFPALCSGWLEALRDHNMERISRLQIRVDQLMDLHLSEWPFVALVKQMLVMQGVIRHADTALPMAPVSQEQKRILAEILDRCGMDGLK